VASRRLGGLRSSGRGFCLGGAGFNPQRYVPAPNSFSDGEICSCRKPASLQAKAAYASHTGYGHKGTWPVPGRYPVHHRGPPSLTPWKTQCAQSILLTAECPSMECRGIDRVWHWSCAGLGAHSGQPGGCSHRPTWTWFPTLVVWGCAPRSCDLHPSIATDGTVRGERYRSARGEILRSLRDPRQRRRSASACPSIKNESPGSKDDQTPS
jgi:hypothetical protein